MVDGAMLVQVLQIGLLIVGGKREIGMKELMGAIGVTLDVVDRTCVMIIPRKLSLLDGEAVKVVVPLGEIGVILLVNVVVGVAAMVGMLAVAVGIGTRKVKEAGVGIERVEVLVAPTEVGVDGGVVTVGVGVGVVMAVDKDVDTTLITVEVVIGLIVVMVILVDGVAMEMMMPEVEIGVIVVMAMLVVGLAATVEVLVVAVGMTMRKMEEEGLVIGVAREVGEEVAIGVEVMGVVMDVASIMEGVVTTTMEVILDIIPPPGTQIPKRRVEMMMGWPHFLVVMVVLVIGVPALVTLELEMLAIAVGVAVEELRMLVAAVGVELELTVRVLLEVVL